MRPRPQRRYHPQMTDPANADRVIHSKTLASGSRFRFVEVTVRDPSGNDSSRQFVEHPGAVAIVPLLVEAGEPDRVVLIRNGRVPVGETLWEVPAGGLEPGEPPETTASRELVEETGYKADVLEHMGRFYTSPGLTDELMHVYFATGLELVGQELEDGERITVHPVEIPEAMAMIERGEIIDAKTMLALYMAREQGRFGEAGAERA